MAKKIFTDIDLNGNKIIGGNIEGKSDQVKHKLIIKKNNEVQEYDGSNEVNLDLSSYSTSGNIVYIEGTSDNNGYITNEVIPTENGYQFLFISRVYLHPELNMWCNCVSYEGTGNSHHIITGGIKVGVSVVVGGSTCYTAPNCLYRTYYLKIPVN